VSGFEILRIFRNHPLTSSILDDLIYFEMKEKNELAYIFNRRDKGCNVKDYTLTENSKKNNTNKNNVVLSEKEVNADSITDDDNKQSTNN